jgi:hypothetical protein
MISCRRTARPQEKGIDPGNIEIWFADEARIGQKNKITRRWARRGTRLSAPTDQRTASTAARRDRHRTGK